METVDFKFKAWHTKLKEWHYYPFLQLLNMECVPQYTNGKAITVSKFDYEHWCTFTGKQDAKGTEIYVGDVYECFIQPYFPAGEQGEWEYKEWVKAGEKMLRCTQAVNSICQEIPDDAVVIGNKFTI